MDPNKAKEETKEETTEEVEVEEETKMEDSMDLKAQLSTMADQIAAMAAQLKERDQQVAKLQEHNARLAYSEGLPLGKPVLLTQGLADLLFPVWRDNPEQFQKVLTEAVQGGVKLSEKKEKAQPVKPVLLRPSPWSQTLASGQESEPEAEPQTQAQLHAACLQEAGGDPVKTKELFKARLFA